jgi:hypothetical protein
MASVAWPGRKRRSKNFQVLLTLEYQQEKLSRYSVEW